MKNISTLIEKVETQLAQVKLESGLWFESKEHYLEMVKAFKSYASNQGNYLGTQHFILYAILRNRDWKKGITTPINPGKLAEHKAKIRTAFLYIESKYNGNTAILAPFGDTVSDEMLDAIRKNIKSIKNG